MRGISNPLLVDFISSRDDESGVLVPMPAAPAEGNVFVCAFTIAHANNKIVVVTS
jgi:hypothetical protein